MLFESHMQRTVAVFPAVEGAIPKPSAPLEPEPDSIMAPRVEAENQTPTTPTASTLAWEDLNGSQRTTAGTIGWDAVAWEAGLTTKTCRKRWAALNEAELSAARLLGYKYANWDAELEGDVTDTTDSDGGFALLEARAAPMKAATILERVGNDWPTVAEVLGEADVGGSSTFEIDLGAGSDTIMPPTPPPRAQSSNIVDARKLYAIYAATALIRDTEESYCLAAALAACKLGRQWERALAMLSAIPIVRPSAQTRIFGNMASWPLVPLEITSWCWSYLIWRAAPATSLTRHLHAQFARMVGCTSPPPLLHFMSATRLAAGCLACGQHSCRHCHRVEAEDSRWISDASPQYQQTGILE